MAKSKKPGPVEGVDYFCAYCTGRRTILCRDCLTGSCDACRRTGGRVKCPGCQGGTIPVQPPEWL